MELSCLCDVICSTCSHIKSLLSVLSTLQSNDMHIIINHYYERPTMHVIHIPKCFPPTPTPTHTHKGHKEIPNGICPPDQLRLGPLHATSGNSGPNTRQTHEGGGPSTHRSTDYAPPLWVGTRSPNYTSVELGAQFPILLGPGLGAK